MKITAAQTSPSFQRLYMPTKEEKITATRNLQHLTALIANYATTALIPLSGLDTKARLRHQARQEFRKIIAERERLNSRFVMIAGEEGTEVVDAAADRLEKWLAPDVQRLYFVLANNYLRHNVPDAYLHAQFDTCGIICAALDLLANAAHKAVENITKLRFANRLPLKTLNYHIARLADLWQGQIPVNTAAHEDQNIQTGANVIYRKLENVEAVLKKFNEK